MDGIINVFEFCSKSIWDLMIQYWFLCTIPIGFIIFIVVDLIKGSTAK